MDDILKRLQEICGPNHASNAMVDRLCYRRDCGPTPGEIPGYITRPETVDELIALVKLANEIKKPLFIWGRATTFVDSGAMEGSIVLALDLMNKYEIDLENQVVVAETGAIWHAIDADLKKLGWELAAPGGGGMFSASVGGTVAYNAVPHGITEYGVTGDHVVTLEVVLPDGTLMHTGSAANEAAGNIPIERSANGTDLAGLFIGSCGTLGIITKVALRIRRIPEVEDFLFYAFDQLDDIVDAVSAIQRQAAATFAIGIFGGPKPDDIPGNYFLHVIIRDSRLHAEERKRACEVICQTFNGRPQDPKPTRMYWTEHMYSWLRNMGPGAYYGSRPYYCPEVSGFLPTQALKEAIPALDAYIAEHKAEWDQHGIHTKGLDVYFSRNAAFLWVDTLYPEMNVEDHQYGLKIRRDISEMLYSRWASPGGIVAGIAPYIMEKLGPAYQLMQTLKKTMDPNNILNPGVLMLGGKPSVGAIPARLPSQNRAIDTVGDLTYQCLRCGFCFDLSWIGPYHMCPSYAYGSFETHSARGRIAVARSILEGEIDYNAEVAERIFSCTMCGSCGAHCFKYIDIRKIFQAMREDMAERGLSPAGLKQITQAVMQERNPYGNAGGDRFRWLKDQSRLDRQAPMALFVGCTPSYIRRSAAQEAVELMDKMGLDYTIASAEWCCAHPLMSAGEREKAIEFMRHNIQTYKDLGVKKLVFVCSGCYETFQREMPEVLGEPLPFETSHLIEVVAEEAEAGRIEFDIYSSGAVATYHDPCTLGRQLGVYEAPRKIIEAIPGLRISEMPRHGKDAFCCGAGSFVRYDFPRLTDTAGAQRWAEAIGTGASVLLTACPACLTQFQQQRSQSKDKMEVMDMVTLVNRVIKVRETVAS
ncbi:MAG: FAD-binding oxidoreductase [Chloroflexi bacterium]|nr:FAD-binding oxidoreductase [Chloroflexota bacterium]